RSPQEARGRPLLAATPDHRARHGLPLRGLTAASLVLRCRHCESGGPWGSPRGTAMRVTLSAAVATVSASALLVVGLDYTTYAVTGDSLLLGRANHAGSPTTLVRHGTGVALSLKSSGQGFPSLRVSSSARVRRLNADLLDGRSASALATHAVSYLAGKRG